MQQNKLRSQFKWLWVVYVYAAGRGLQEQRESVCACESERRGREGRRGLESEENNSGTCTGNTSIFSPSPRRAKQKHELNDFGRGEWESGGWGGVCVGGVFLAALHSYIYESIYELRCFLPPANPILACVCRCSAYLGAARTHTQKKTSRCGRTVSVVAG